VIQLEGSKHWLLYEPITQLPNDYRKTNNPDSLKVPSYDLILNVMFFFNLLLRKLIYNS